MLVGLVLLVDKKYRNTVLIALIGASVATQSLNLQYWARFWEIESNLWWQLTWRAPDIRDNTVLMAYLPGEYRFQQGYETWGPANLIYRPGDYTYPQIQSEVLNEETSLYILLGGYREPHVRDIYVPMDYQNFLLLD